MQIAFALALLFFTSFRAEATPPPAERRFDASAARAARAAAESQREREPFDRARWRQGMINWAVKAARSAYEIDLSGAAVTFVNDGYRDLRPKLILESATHSCKFQPNFSCSEDPRCRRQLDCVPR